MYHSLSIRDGSKTAQALAAIRAGHVAKPPERAVCARGVPDWRACEARRDNNRRAKGKRSLDDKVLSGLKIRGKILAHIMKTGGRFSYASLRAGCGLTNSEAEHHATKLVNSGYVERLPRRGFDFSARLVLTNRGRAFAESLQYIEVHNDAT